MRCPPALLTALAFVLPPVSVAAFVVACGTSTDSSVSPLGDGGPVPALDGAAQPSGDGAAEGGAPVPRGTCAGAPIPDAEHFVAPGLCAGVVAANVAGLRQIAFAPNGDLFGTTASGSIRRFRDVDGDGFFRAEEIKEWATTGGNGNNADIDAAGGFVYAGTPNGVKRWPYSATAETGGAGEDVVTGQPSSGHSKHTVHVYDGFLYVHSGSADNMSSPTDDYDLDRSLIRRFKLSDFAPGTPFAWGTGEVVTKGLRNANGFTKNAAGRMYAVVNGMDNVSFGGQDVHNDNPGEQIVEIGVGKAYGYPFCFTAQRVVRGGGGLVPPGVQLPSMAVHDEAWCQANSLPPSTFVQAHSAPLDIVFFDSQPAGALPEKYRGGAFVAQHGSWNRAPSTGYKVVWIPYDAAGNTPMPTSTESSTTFPHETIFGGGDPTGEKDGPWTWATKDYTDAPRPAGVAVSPIDGALFVASDAKGYLYRITSAK